MIQTVLEAAPSQPDMTPASPSAGMLFQMISQNHELAEAGHKRLRTDVREIEKELDRIVAQQGALMAMQGTLTDKLAKVETTPLNMDKVSFSGRQLAAIVGACVVLAGAMWQLHVGIDSLAIKIEQAQKLQDERNETQKQAMDQLRAAIEMRRVEIQNLSNFIQQNVVPRQGVRP